MPIMLGKPREIASMGIKLDADQQKAVEHSEGPALVVAGPGSGKTTVIKERILHLIQEHDIDPNQILALAFNRKASQEMEQRLTPKLKELGLYRGKPEIRTLHAFGRRIINRNYRQLNLKMEPTGWGSSKLEETIRWEGEQLKREKANAKVTIYIYKIGSKVTDKCYIGQTVNPDRRKAEHLADSSNSDLRQTILAEGREHFTFEVIDEVKGRFADSREAKWIEIHKNRAVFNLEVENEHPEIKPVDGPVTIYKIKSKVTGKCYISHTKDPKWIEGNFMHLPNDELRKAIKNEGHRQFAFEVLHDDVPAAEAMNRAAQEIEIHKNRAVFNQNNPLSQRYSDRLLIELFCQHFNICYEELLKHPSDVENLDAKIRDFEKMAREVEKSKREIAINFSSTNSINDVVRSIIESIDDRVVRAFAEKYENKKKDANAVDYQDMIIYSAYLLETCPKLRQHYCDKYPYVLVDEFQDVSRADFRMISQLSENLFAVGDDDQAIYGFRGGNSHIMRQDFGNRESVVRYEITCNYRSTAAIVEHASALISYNNPHRIPKNLRVNNPMRLPIKILETTEETVKSIFLREFVEPVCQTQFIDNRIPPISEDTLLKVPIETQRIGIPLRYRYEVEAIRRTLLARGFEEVKGEARRKEGDPFKVIGRGAKEIIEGGTIHRLKGKEYDKVILIHNTLGKNFPFHDSGNITEERRVFYVAMTRAKQELVILGGNCQFVAETGLSALTPKRKKQLERVSRALGSAIVKRIDIATKQLEEVSEAVLAALKAEFKKQARIAPESARKQYEPELNRLRRAATEAENAAKKAAMQLQTGLPTDLKAANEALLEGLIPILDSFGSVVERANQNVETDNDPDDFAVFTESVRLAQTQLLDLLKHHGLKSIEPSLGEIFNQDHHEEISSVIYSDEIPTDRIAKVEQRGYLLHNQVVRKAQVVVSKGQNPWMPEKLDQVVEIYLDRLIFAFQAKYQLTNIDKPLVKREMVKYLLELDDESVEKIGSFAAKDAAEAIQLKRYADYCAGQEKLHRCTDVFRDFWSKMWEVIKTLDEDIKQAAILKSEMAWKHINHPSEVVSVGEEVEVKVIKFDREDEKISLSLKHKTNDPWENVEEKYPVGSTVQGTIINIVRYGVFFELEEGVEGLIHVSEMSWTQRDVEPSHIVNKGDKVEAMVLEISKDSRRISLSIKQCQQNPFEVEAVEPSPDDPGTIAEIESDISSEPPEPTIAEPIEETEEAKPPAEDLPLVAKAEKDCLDESIDSIAPESLQEVDDNLPPMLQDSAEILKTHIQALKPEPIETGIVSEPPEAVNNTSQLTPQEYKDILNKHIGELKIPSEPMTSEAEPTPLLTDEPSRVLEAEKGTSVNQTKPTHLDSLEGTPDNSQIERHNLSEDEIQDVKKGFGHYLRQFGRFVTRKLK